MITDTFDIPALELKKRSSGKIIERMWYPYGDIFSFFDFFFTLARNSSSEVYGAWMIGQNDVRRYVFSFSEFYLLHTELRYVADTPDSVSELEFDNVFETRCLSKISTWIAPLKVEMSSTEDSVTVVFTAHPMASAEYTFADRRMFSRYISTLHQKWCDFIPALRINDFWVIALGGAFSIFIEQDGQEQEIAILSSEIVIELSEEILNWGGENLTLTRPPVQVSLLEDGVTLQIYSHQFKLTFREAEALASFLTRRLFLSESGNFLRWKDQQSQHTKVNRRSS